MTPTLSSSNTLTYKQGEIVNQKPGPIPVGSTAKEIALSVERKVPQESEKSGKHEDTFLDDQVSKSTLSTKKASVTVEGKGRIIFLVHLYSIYCQGGSRSMYKDFMLFF